MTPKVKSIIIAVLFAIAALNVACALEGGAPGREVCVNCEESK